jgi:hypothetical protein
MVPTKAIAYTATMIGLASYALQIMYTIPSPVEIQILRGQLRSWHFIPYLTLPYRLACLIVITSVIVSIWTKQDNVVRVFSGLDTQPVKVTSNFNHFYAFTVWCWTLEGCFFAAAVLIDLGFLHGTFAIELTHILFEFSLAFAMLVTTVSNFVLIPGAIKANNNLDTLFSTRALLMHNANLLFMTVELVFSHVTFNFLHFPFAILYGLAYVIFSWYVAARRGYFLYWFINYNYKHVLISYSVLIAVLTMFFGIAGAISHLVDPQLHWWTIPIIFFGASRLCRFTQ